MAPNTTSITQLTRTRITTPLGNMIALANKHALLLLAFQEIKGLECIVHRYKSQGIMIHDGLTAPLRSIQKEITAYFNGSLRSFATPIFFNSSEFSRTAWTALTTIPYGETRSYKEQATRMGKPYGYRAVGNANSKNPLSVIIPCHRVIKQNGDIGGYAAGHQRKIWLLEHEKSFVSGHRTLTDFDKTRGNQ